MAPLLALGAAVLALRLAGRLATRRRAATGAALIAWSGALVAYAVACAALAWGSAAGWDARAFRVYYLFGGLLAAPLLGAGSLLLVGERRWIAPVTCAYVGLASGVAVAMPLRGAVHGRSIPAAADHLAFVPARLVATAANAVGTVAVIAVAIATLRRRPLGNVLIVAGVAVAAVGSGVRALGAGGTAAAFGAAVILLAAGVAPPRSLQSARRLQTLRRGTRLSD